MLLATCVGPNIGEAITETAPRPRRRLAMGVSIRHWVRQAGRHRPSTSPTAQVFFASCVVRRGRRRAATVVAARLRPVVEDGVLCEPTCHVVGAEDIVAAGDVAHAGRTCASTACSAGSSTGSTRWRWAAPRRRTCWPARRPREPYTPVPRFWTEQYGMRIQGAGLPALGKDTARLSTAHRLHHRRQAGRHGGHGRPRRGDQGDRRGVPPEPSVDAPSLGSSSHPCRLCFCHPCFCHPWLCRPAAAACDGAIGQRTRQTVGHASSRCGGGRAHQCRRTGFPTAAATRQVPGGRRDFGEVFTL